MAQFRQEDFATVQPAAARLARVLYFRLNESDVAEPERAQILGVIDGIRDGGLDVHAPFDARSRALFARALQHFIDDVTASIDQTDDYAVEALGAMIYPFTALLEYFQGSSQLNKEN